MSQSATNKTVFIVSGFNPRHLSRQLQEDGFNVQTFSEVEPAINRASEQKPYAVIVDDNMQPAGEEFDHTKGGLRLLEELKGQGIGLILQDRENRTSKEMAQLAGGHSASYLDLSYREDQPKVDQAEGPLHNNYKAIIDKAAAAAALEKLGVQPRAKGVSVA